MENITIEKKQTVIVVETITVSKEAQVIIDALEKVVNNSPTGVGFVSIKNYLSKGSGQVANHLLNVGADYAKAKAKDKLYLENIDVTTIKDRKSDVLTLQKAKTALLNAKPRKSTVTYTQICKGLKVHNESGAVYIWGLAVSKKIIVEGVFKTVNSSALTIAKNEIKKGYKTSKYRQFIVKNIDAMKLNGETLEF